MQPTYSTTDMARLRQGEYERQARAARQARLEHDGVTFMERLGAAAHGSRREVAAGAAAAAVLAGVLAALH